MPVPILPRLRPDVLRAAVVIIVSSLLACDSTSGQGGVDAQSRKARADSIRRAQRAAQAKAPAPAAATPAVAPAAAPKSAVATAAGGAASATKPAVKRPSAVTAPAGASSAVAAAKRPPAATKTAPAVSSGAASKGTLKAVGAAAAGTAAAAAASAPATAPAPAAVPSASVTTPAPVAPPVSPTPSAAATQPSTTTATPAPAPAAPPAATPAPARTTSAALPQRRYTTRELDSIRTRWTVEEPVVWVASPLARRVSPGLGFATPSGYGPAWGDFFMSLSYQQRTRFTTRQDGAVGIGMGLGDPVQNLGGELVYSSFGTVNRGFFSNGTVSVRAHRIIRGFGVSAGFENVLEVGRQTSAGPDGGRSFFLAVSQLRRIGVTDSVTTTEPTDGQELIWTLGLGDGRFRREADVAASKATMNLFGSVGYRFAQRFAAIADYTGQDVTVALSVAPFRCVPLVVTPGFADITHSAGDGARFVLAVGFSTRLDQDAFFRRPCTR